MPVYVDIADLMPFYAGLPPDEQDEQLRDWALYGLCAAEGAAGGLPLRLQKDPAGEVAPGRVAVRSSREWWLVADENSFENRPLLGNLIDRTYARLAVLPETIRLYSCRPEPGNRRIALSFVQTLPVSAFFTAEYGYREQTARTAEGLARFLASVDDLTFAGWEGGVLRLGGRKYAEGFARSMSLEDAAALYQAYHESHDAEYRRRYNEFIRTQYAGVLTRDRGLRRAVAAGKVKREWVFGELRRRIPYTPPADDAIVGFSLDPAVDESAAAADLEKLARKDAKFLPPGDDAFAAYIDSRSVALAGAVRRLREEKRWEPFLELRRAAASRDGLDRRFNDVLRMIELENSYQAARYDGRLQGTHAGMLLFYTDLLAKLWALDYCGSAPRGKIRGFTPLSSVRIPKLYWEDFLKLSKTRLWFGLRTDAFTISAAALHFAPVATRVYAASSDPLFPGRESQPNYQSARFLGWWDRHYEAVADYEPAYHRLNQIQKWGCLIMTLKEANSPALDFLKDVPVNASLDFEQWISSADVPANAFASIAIPFIDRKARGKGTECLSLLRSNDYPLMGERFFLSGGVSLASRKDILAKLRAGAASPRRVTAPRQKTARRTPSLPAPGRSLSLSATAPRSQAAPALAAAPAFPARKQYGKIAAEKSAGGVKLVWKKGARAVLDEFVEGLARMQDAKDPAAKDERIFGVLGAERTVRLEQWKAYLVKLGDDWIYLSINGEKAGKDFLSKASGTEPDSDIFAAKLISAARARSLSAGKESISLPAR